MNLIALYCICFIFCLDIIKFASVLRREESTCKCLTDRNIVFNMVFLLLQYKLIITLSLGSIIEIDCVISETLIY